MRGRGASYNTPNRFDKLHFEPLEIDLDPNDPDDRPLKTIFLKDASKSVLSKNESPDIHFTYSINPYRGCEHGCIYCYARPSHEYLGFSAGADFESKITVKADAPELLAEAFQKKSWQPQMVCISGNTDCYQPVERKLQITRRCLEVFLKFRNPVGIITKNALIQRDLDILIELAKLDLVSVTISVTTLDDELTRIMEPRTSTPAKRLETIEKLTAAGVPVYVLVAPIIPGLTDDQFPGILKAVAARGAKSAGYTVVRLPGAVGPLFEDWLKRTMPDRAAKILNRIRESHGGNADDTRWGKRMSGDGEFPATIKKLFRIECKRLGLNEEEFHVETKHFRRDGGKEKVQGELF
ncbi:MAG TPA: PA0069 family radical SAM protein [Bacteroidota bacterium]|nr:PA0069 family radical SAM protein [Bacteroidota bacterium]